MMATVGDPQPCASDQGVVHTGPLMAHPSSVGVMIQRGPVAISVADGEIPDLLRAIRERTGEAATFRSHWAAKFDVVETGIWVRTNDSGRDAFLPESVLADLAHLIVGRDVHRWRQRVSRQQAAVNKIESELSEARQELDRIKGEAPA